jgi:hypothetical protein
MRMRGYIIIAMALLSTEAFAQRGRSRQAEGKAMA